MNPPPHILGGAKLIRWSAIDDRHRSTDQCRHYANGQLQGIPAAIAICQFGKNTSFYLLCCDSEWNTLNDTFHLTLDDAMHQAEFEFEGVRSTWIIV